MAGFNTAITGLKSASTDLDVTGNNIANSSTVGFKSSRTEFADIYATAVVGAGSSNTAGSGVTVSDIAQDFSAGTIEFTNNNLDLAINGSGFFQLDNGQGSVTYTRAGAFELDKSGNIVSKDGKNLQGYGIDDQGNLLPVGNLAVTQKESPPKATTNIDLSVNIDSRADATKLLTPYSKDEPSSFTYSTTVRTFDSLGNEHTVKLNMVEQPPVREVQTLEFDALPNSVTISGYTFDPSDGISAAESAALINADPRIADISISGSNLVVRMNASATDIDELQVVNNDAGVSFSGISSAQLAANEAHTYGVAAGPLAADTVVEIGGVEIALDSGMTQDQMGAALASRQGAIKDLNPDVESVIYDANNGELIITFKAASGDIADGMLAVSDPGAIIGAPAVTPGDNSFQGVYQMYAYLNGEELLDIGKVVDPGEAGFASQQSEVGPVLITFDPSSGLLNSINGQQFLAGGSVPGITIAGADPANAETEIRLDMSNTTQFASASIVKTQNQDGYTKGDLVGVSFGGNGEMIASFSNGQNQQLGVVAIATFENQAGLRSSGGTEWTATLDSGSAIVNPPGSGLSGSLRSAALEQSNVDLSAELVSLIEAQRNFQANSKTLETLNTVTQTILQI
ncbi:flagellar biosynthesis protein FlgE [Marinobacterium aestuarii]|uniref:Flagellar hook protein FlgE n=1 Tax=Marinobacterium aestuarii TaxID=1821621 RepID=A0A1A9EUZ5_9GAMM|nr:flagellar hook protein FlgE [Marinobacterium aestuarii]ANG61725.1 flagellar biosynthesis protein FlgE [Marinobacterium aestuarii]